MHSATIKIRTFIVYKVCVSATFNLTAKRACYSPKSAIAVAVVPAFAAAVV